MMEFSLSDAKDVAAIIAGLGGVVATAVLWRLKGEFASKADMKAAQDRLDEVETDVAEIKVRMTTLPDHEDMSELKTRLASVEGSVRVVSTELAGLREVMERIERPLNRLLDFHMRGDK